MSKFRDLWLRLYMIKQFLNDDNSIRQTDSAYQMPLREGVRVDLQTHTHTQLLRHNCSESFMQTYFYFHLCTKMHAIYKL